MIVNDPVEKIELTYHNEKGIEHKTSIQIDPFEIQAGCHEAYNRDIEAEGSLLAATARVNVYLTSKGFPSLSTAGVRTLMLAVSARCEEILKNDPTTT